MILPTHHCFDDALDYIQLRVKAEPSLVTGSGLTLVHGIAVAPNGPHQGELYAHAWVEEGKVCIDAGMIDGRRIWYAVERDEYYESHQIQETTRYTLREAWAANSIAENYGPWEPQYKELCGGRRIFGAIAADVQTSAATERS